MKKILLVDDEPNIIFLLQRSFSILENQDFEVIKASNGKEALEMVETEKPDLVFLDIMMPYVDGLEVCRRVKKEMGLTGTYIIMLTAKGQDFDKAKAKEAGADEFIQKPFDPMEIIDKTREFLERAN